MNEGARNEIKELVKTKYGFSPENDEINYINDMLRLTYFDLHQFRIVNHIATSSIFNSLMKYRAVKGYEFDNIYSDKLIFKYLRLARKCFEEALNFPAICMCRTAIESGLIERVAEEQANIDGDTTRKFEKKVLNYMKKNKNEMLHRNLEHAEKLKMMVSIQ